MTAPASSLTCETPRRFGSDATASGCVEYLCASLVLATGIFFLFYPGLMSKDSMSSLQQARSLEFSDWHPPIMSLIWRPLDYVYAGSSLMLMLQALVFSVSIGLLAYQARTLLPRIRPTVAVLLLGAFPPVVSLIGVIWKDVWMSSFLVLALASLLGLQQAKSTMQRRVWLAMVISSCLLATSFRHNGMAATAGLLAGASYFALGHKLAHVPRLIAACTAGVLLSLLLASLVSTLTRMVATKSHPETVIFLHDIAGSVTYSDSPPEAAEWVLSTYPTLTSKPVPQFLAALGQSYNAADANGSVRGKRRRNPPFAVNVFDPNHDAILVKNAWKATISRYPEAYLKHRFDGAICLFQFCDIVFWENASYVLNENFTLKNLDPSSGRYQARDVILNRAFSRLYSPSLWLVFSLAAGILALRRMSLPHSVFLFAALSVLGLTVSMFFASPIASFRYVHWIAIVGWLSALMLFGEAKRHKMLCSGRNLPRQAQSAEVEPLAS